MVEKLEVAMIQGPDEIKYRKKSGGRHKKTATFEFANWGRVSLTLFVWIHSFL